MSSDVQTYRLIGSRAEFHDALRQAFAEAGRVGCREMFLCDVDFADWPLGEPALIEDLTRWALAHRKLTLLAQSFDAIVKRHARFVQWRRQWSHVIECRALEDAEPGDLPIAMLADGVVAVRVFDPVHLRGSLSHDAGDLTRCREAIDDALARSVETFPATTLGL